MIITYFRSSSWNTFNSCEQQYYMQYVLGMDNPAGKKATKGNVTHKILECLASYKLCLQNGDTSFVDDTLGALHLKDCTVSNLLNLSYDWHKANYVHDWDDVIDKKDCEKWANMALTFQNGLFDPRNRNIIIPEQKFDFEINQPWAQYAYRLSNGKRIVGKLALKGTMDLITEVRPGVIEIIDWKTGGTMKDFATGKDKDFYSLHNDAQLRLYHYAANQLWPDAEDIIMTIYFIRAGGPYTLMLNKNDLPKTEKLIRKKFEQIKRTVKPRLNPGPPWTKKPSKIANFKCMKLCAFANTSKHDPAKTECQFIRDQIVQIGIQRTTEKYGNLDKISSYGDGGGRHESKTEGEK